MLGTAPGNSGPLPGEDGLDEDEAPLEFEGAVALAGSRPVACASAADNSPPVRRTSLPLSPGPEGRSSRFTFSWKDCTLAAVAAGETGAATGAGLRNTRTSVRTEIARVTRLMTRCHFKRHLHRWIHGIRRRERGLDDGGTATRWPLCYWFGTWITGLGTKHAPERDVLTPQSRARPRHSRSRPVRPGFSVLCPSSAT